tara:strand:- start:185 stop:706 length:522 start_codon:yes stop_codon:yes gene_type:complete
MAIKDMQGTVATTTGIMNNKPTELKVPDMSNMKMPKGMANTKPVQVAQKPVEEPADSLTQKIQNLTNEDKAVLSTVLSPSVSNVLTKIAPEISDLVSRFRKDEENVVLPVSIVKNYASRKYPGDEQQSIQSFVSDLAGQMDQTNVPPGTTVAEQPETGVENTLNNIDSDQMLT